MNLEEAYQRLARHNGFEIREQQVKASKVVLSFLRDESPEPLYFQGETGAGKTIAYLMALVGFINDWEIGENTIPAADRTRTIDNLLSETDFNEEDPSRNPEEYPRGQEIRIAVIATATKILQHQILQKDLPALQRAGLLDFPVAVVTGSSNYLCPERLKKLLNKNKEALPKKVVSFIRQALADTEKQKVTQDIPEDVLSYISICSPSGGVFSCINCLRDPSTCLYRQEVHVPLLTIQQQKKGIIIMNHHMIFHLETLGTVGQWILRSDTLRRVGVSVRPCFIIDEGHSFSKLVMRNSSVVFTRSQIHTLSDALASVLKLQALFFFGRQGTRGQLREKIDMLGDCKKENVKALKDALLDFIDTLFLEKEKEVVRREIRKLNKQHALFVKEIARTAIKARYQNSSKKVLREVQLLLEQAYEHIKATRKKQEELFQKAYSVPLDPRERKDPEVLLLKQKLRNRNIKGCFESTLLNIVGATETVKKLFTLSLRQDITIPFEKKLFNFYRRYKHYQNSTVAVLKANRAEEAYIYLGQSSQNALAIYPLNPRNPLRGEGEGENNKPLKRVYTSATLAPYIPRNARRSEVKRFLRPFIREVGEKLENLKVLHMQSPFCYDNVLLYIAQNAPNPTQTEWEKKLPSYVKRLVEASSGGALVLLTREALMQPLAEFLRRECSLPICTQAERPVPELKGFLYENENGVLIGLASLWQGFDVPGDALRHVIITKLPFSEPSSPEACLARYYFAREAVQEERNRSFHRFFIEHEVPRTALYFRQMFGRLVRSPEDKGVVSVLDPRILTKNYGRLFLKVIPAGVQQTTNIEDVEAYFATNYRLRQETDVEQAPALVRG